MEGDFLRELIGNVGVPAVICIYTLWGVNKTLKELTGAINKLASDVDRREDEQSKEIGALKDKVHELTFKVEGLLRRE